MNQHTLVFCPHHTYVRNISSHPTRTSAKRQKHTKIIIKKTKTKKDSLPVRPSNRVAGGARVELRGGALILNDSGDLEAGVDAVEARPGLDAGERAP